MKIHPVGVEFFSRRWTNGEAGRQADMTRLMVTFFQYYEGT